MSGRMRIGVIGAGIGGLTQALALRRHGLDCVVFERAPALAEVGAGITLWMNATRVLQHVGVYEPVLASGHLMSSGVIGNSEGRVIGRSDWSSAFGSEPLTGNLAIHRAELQQHLYDAIGPGRVSLGRPCTGYRIDGDQAVALFEDGGEEPFDVLIGADGIHSAVRRQLLGELPARYSGYTCWRGVTQAPPDWKGESGEFWGPGRRFGVLPIGGGRLYWFATDNRPQDVVSPSSERKEELRRLFEGWAFQVPDILEATPAEAILHNDIVDRPPVKRWSEGPVTLIGDAIHPTTPNFGQGAAMAIESALVLARCLEAAPSPLEALSWYADLRQERTRSITQGSLNAGRMGQIEGGLIRALRDGLMSWVPDSVKLAGLQRLVVYDATTLRLPEA